MIRPTNYVICAAGHGKRFSDLLPGKSKPLIKIFDKTSLEIALESLPIYADDKIIIVVQKQHEVKKALLVTLQNKHRFNEIRWLEIENVTRGQLETAYLAKDLFELNHSLAIFNCDTFFQSRELAKLMQDETIEGIIPCSEEPGNSWSFCQIDQNKNVVDIREKERISDLASVGLYYFRDVKKFLKMTEEELQESAVGGEYYVANLYKKYLAQNEKLVVAAVDLFKPMGTPEQIQSYWKLSSSEIIAYNQEKKVLVIDLDNTITIEESDVSYNSKKPNLAVIAKIQEYKKMGYEIIINSSRRMRTHKNDEAKVIAEISEITLSWLRKHQVPFDGIKFGKPFAEGGFYVDDKTIRPDEFVNLSLEEIKKLVGFTC